MIDYRISELNKTAVNFGVENRVRFYNDDAVKIACNLAPYGRVAVIYNKISFSGFGKSMTEQLKRAGIKPINFIMPENTILNLSSVFDVICVPDDVRAVLVFDRELMDIAAYIATLFKIPVIFTLNSINTDGVLYAKVPFFWGGNKPETDFFTVDCVYHVIIGDNALKSDELAEQYINVYGKLIALIDYRVKLAITGGNLYDFARETIFNAVNAVSDDLKAETLLTYGLKIELAGFAASGDIDFNSAEYAFKRLIGFKEEKGLRFSLIKKLTALYLLCANENEMPFDIPDYNKRAKELAGITKSDDGAFLKGFLAQLNALKGKDLLRLKADLKDDIIALADAFKVAEQNYIKLGGNLGADFSPYVKALKYCGDLPNTVNFMTVLRECGFLESV